MDSPYIGAPAGDPTGHPHAELDAQAVAWAMDALDRDEGHQFAAHLAGCARCIATVAQTQETLAELALASVQPALPTRTTEPSPIPDDTAEAIAGSTNGSRPESDSSAAGDGRGGAHRRGRIGTVTPIGPARERRRRGTLIGLTAAAVAAIVALGAWNVVLQRNGNDSDDTASAYRQAVEAMTVPGARTGQLRTTDGTAAATLIVAGDRVSVVSSSMAANDATTSVYVLWGKQTEAGPAVAVGTFDMREGAIDTERVSTAGRTIAYPDYAVSKETGRTPPRAPSTVLATGAVAS